VYCHAYGENATNGTAKYESALLAAIATIYPMVKFDAGVYAGGGTTGSDNWGNTNAQTRLGQAITWLQDPAGGGAASGTVLLVCQSMGHALASNYTQAHAANVAAIVGWLPVCDLDNIRDGWPTLRTTIEGAWGTGAWTAPGTPALPAGANPAVPANYTNLTAIPHLMYYASDDILVTPATVTTLAAGIGAAAQAISLGPGGHTDASVGHVPTLDVLLFLAAHA
jgi:hypothetical protein